MFETKWASMYSNITSGKSLHCYKSLKNFIRCVWAFVNATKTDLSFSAFGGDICQNVHSSLSRKGARTCVVSAVCTLLIAQRNVDREVNRSTGSNKVHTYGDLEKNGQCHTDTTGRWDTFSRIAVHPDHWYTTGLCVHIIVLLLLKAHQWHHNMWIPWADGEGYVASLDQDIPEL